MTTWKGKIHMDTSDFLMILLIAGIVLAACLGAQ